MSEEMQIRYNGVLYRFPEKALEGVPDPVITASVSRDGFGELTYRIYAQRKQQDHYLAYHGCSFCALSSMIGAFADPAATPLCLARNRYSLLGLQRRPRLPGRLSRPERMPLNIAGACRLMQLYSIKADYLDRGSEESLRAFITAKTEIGLPVLLTGKRIPSLTGEDLCPRGAHTVLLIGMKDPRTLIAADSAGSNTQRVKFASMDDLLSGILAGGLERGLDKGKYFYARGVQGGVIAPRSWPARQDPASLAL